jgi:hypothetical protein
MPHFSDDLRAEDPEVLRRLRTLLHGPGPAPRRLPTRADRFGVAAPARPRDRQDAALVGPDRSPDRSLEPSPDLSPAADCHQPRRSPR